MPPRRSRCRARGMRRNCRSAWGAKRRTHEGKFRAISQQLEQAHVRRIQRIGVRSLISTIGNSHMKKRKLAQNLEVSAIGLGCMGLSFGLGPATNKKEAIAARPSIVASPYSTPRRATVRSSTSSWLARRWSRFATRFWSARSSASRSTRRARWSGSIAGPSISARWSRLR